MRVAPVLMQLLRAHAVDRIGRDLRVFMISLGALLNQPFLTLSLIAGLMNAETVRRVVVARGDE